MGVTARTGLAMANGRRIKLAHVMTAPQSLFYLIRGQVPFMRERGIDIVGVAAPGELLEAFAERDGVPVVAVDMSREISPLRDVLSLLRLVRALRRERPDIVQSGTPKGGFLGMVAAWIARVPVRIYTIRGLPLEAALGTNRRVLWMTEWVACRLAHRVVCVSPLLRLFVIEEGICPASKIVTFGGGSGNGVDASGRYNPDRVGTDARLESRRQYGIPAEATVLGYVGRLGRFKGIAELAETWQVLRERYPQLHLLLVGSFDGPEAVSDETRRLLTTDSRVHLVGQTDDLPPLYTAMDVFVLPTYREGVPNVVLEASAMRLPIVSTRVTGPLDVIVDGETGLLVPARDAAALAEAIACYLNDAELRERHARAARDRVLAAFRQEDIWEAWYQEYVSLLREHGGCPAAAASEASAVASNAAVG